MFFYSARSPRPWHGEQSHPVTVLQSAALAIAMLACLLSVSQSRIANKGRWPINILLVTGYWLGTLFCDSVIVILFSATIK